MLFTLMLTISTVVLLKYVYLRFTTKRIFLNKEHDYFYLLLMPNISRPVTMYPPEKKQKRPECLNHIFDPISFG